MTTKSKTVLTAYEKLAPEIQQRILNASADVFAKEGYHHASVANICSAAKISNGALYKYFKNKEAVFFAVLDSSIILVEDIYKKYLVSGAPFFEAIENLLNGLAEYACEHKYYTCIYSDLGSSSMNRFAFIASEKFKTASSFYTLRLVKEAKRNSEIDSDLDENMAAYLVDNYITCFSYSMVSQYHKSRFNSFFARDGSSPDQKEMIRVIVLSIRQAFGRHDIKSCSDRE